MSSKNVIWCLASETSLYEEQTTFAPDLLLANYLVLGRREGFTMIVHRTSSVSSPITLHLGCDRLCSTTTAVGLVTCMCFLSHYSHKMHPCSPGWHWHTELMADPPLAEAYPQHCAQPPAEEQGVLKPLWLSSGHAAVLQRTRMWLASLNQQALPQWPQAG